MHLQIRSKAQLSPPNIDKFLERLERDGVNLGGAGGVNPVFGGEFAVALEDEDKDKAKGALEKSPKYEYNLYEAGVNPELYLCWAENKPGELRRCIAEATAANRGSARKVRDVLIGVQRPEGIPIQVYSEIPEAP